MSSSLDELYQRHAPMVYRRCKAILRNDDEAWDGVQEVFLKVAEQTGRVAASHSPTAYLYGMATHYSLNRLKRERRSVNPPDEEVIDVQSATEDDHIRAVFLGQLFHQVPARTRELAWFRWVDRLTWEETALAAGLSVSGVRKHLTRFTAFARAYKEHV